DARVAEGRGRGGGQEARLDTGGGAGSSQELGPALAGRRAHRRGGALRHAEHASRARPAQEEAPARRALHTGVHAGPRVAPMAGGAGRLIALVGLSLLLSSAPHHARAHAFTATPPNPHFHFAP